MGLLAALSKSVSAHHHTGLHYVPSFNDLGTNAADDMEAEELGHMQPESAPTSPNASRMSNKAEDGWPAFGPGIPDIHAMRKTPSRRDHLVDSPRDPKGSPSVMEYILQSENMKRVMDERRAMSGSDTVVRREDVQAAPPRRAAPAVTAVARDGGEYKAFMDRYTSEPSA